MKSYILQEKFRKVWVISARWLYMVAPDALWGIVVIDFDVAAKTVECYMP